LNVIDLIFI